MACSQFNSHFIQPNYFCFLSVSRRLIPDFARWRDGRRPGAHAGKRGIQRTQLVNSETHRLEFRVARVQPSQATRRQPEKKHLKPSMTFLQMPTPGRTAKMKGKRDLSQRWWTSSAAKSVCRRLATSATGAAWCRFRIPSGNGRFGSLTIVAYSS